MSSQPPLKIAPSLPPSSHQIIDGTPVYSSFEHFEPGLQFLSNDPSSDAGRRLAQQEERQQQATLQQGITPQGGTTNSNDPASNDSDFVDLLYVVNPAGKTSVINVTSSQHKSATSTPPTSATSAPSKQDVLPAKHDDHSQAACLPALGATFDPHARTTTVVTGSGSAADRLKPEPELKAQELDCEAKPMRWWPSAEADELKVERM